jgi:hypothetical protein
MTTSQWILLIALGAAMGFLGQTIRIIVGLKKVNDQAAASNQTFGELFQAPTLIISLLIGATAGALAAIVVKPEASLARETLMGFAAAGYSGADFIEGFISKYLPGRAPLEVPAVLNASPSAPSH